MELKYKQKMGKKLNVFILMSLNEISLNIFCIKEMNFFN